MFDFVFLLIRKLQINQHFIRHISVFPELFQTSNVIMNIKSFTRSTFVLVFISFQFNLMFASSVTYYLEPYLKGPSTLLRMERGICYELTGTYNNNRMNSIDPGKNCVELYTGRNCRKNFIRVAPGRICMMDLSNCKMRNVISSLKLC